MNSVAILWHNSWLYFHCNYLIVPLGQRFLRVGNFIYILNMNNIISIILKFSPTYRLGWQCWLLCTAQQGWVSKPGTAFAQLGSPRRAQWVWQESQWLQKQTGSCTFPSQSLWCSCSCHSRKRPPQTWMKEKGRDAQRKHRLKPTNMENPWVGENVPHHKIPVHKEILRSISVRNKLM